MTVPPRCARRARVPTRLSGSSAPDVLDLGRTEDERHATALDPDRGRTRHASPNSATRRRSQRDFDLILVKYRRAMP